MFDIALAPYSGVERSSRIGPLARPSERLSTAELVTLLAAGILAALAVALISPGLRMPGSAILRVALPMICGVALVPRRLSGSMMTIGAGLTALALSAAHLGSLQPASLTALLALGPAIDVTMALPAPSGWRLYLRFGAAGALANAVAFFARAGASWLHVDAPRPHTVTHYGFAVFLSFAVCGLIAGLLGAAVCFRASARSE
jgi:hypothetical protein